MKPPPLLPRQALLLESSLESSSRPPPAAAATNTVSHSHQQKAIACTSERAKQIIESREYHQPSRTNQSILSHRSGAHQPQCQRRSNRSAPQWVCVVCAPQRKSTPGQPHMTNLKLPYDTRVAQQPEPVSPKDSVKVSALSPSRELRGPCEKNIYICRDGKAIQCFVSNESCRINPYKLTVSRNILVRLHQMR